MEASVPMKWEILFLDTIFNLNKNVWMGIRLQKENLNGRRNGISLDPYFFTALVTIFWFVTNGSNLLPVLTNDARISWAFIYDIIEIIPRSQLLTTAAVKSAVPLITKLGQRVQNFTCYIASCLLRPFVASIIVSTKEIREEDESLPSPFSNFHKYVCQKPSRRKKGIHTNCKADGIVFVCGLPHTSILRYFFEYRKC